MMILSFISPIFAVILLQFAEVVQCAAPKNAHMPKPKVDYTEDFTKVIRKFDADINVVRDLLTNLEKNKEDNANVEKIAEEIRKIVGKEKNEATHQGTVALVEPKKVKGADQGKTLAEKVETRLLKENYPLKGAHKALYKYEISKADPKTKANAMIKKDSYLEFLEAAAVFSDDVKVKIDKIREEVQALGNGAVVLFDPKATESAQNEQFAIVLHGVANTVMSEEKKNFVKKIHEKLLAMYNYYKAIHTNVNH